MIKDFEEVSRVVAIMTSESNFFSSFKVISGGLGLKTLKRYIANVSVFSSSLLT